MIDGYVTEYGFSSEAIHRDLKIDGIEHQQANYYEKIDTLDVLLAEANSLRDELIEHAQKHNLSDEEFEDIKNMFLSKTQQLSTYGASYLLDYLTVFAQLIQ